MPPSTRPSASVWAIRLIYGRRLRSRLLVPGWRRVDSRGRLGLLREYRLELALLDLADHAAQVQRIAVAVGRELDVGVLGVEVGRGQRLAHGLGLGALGLLHGDNVALDAEGQENQVRTRAR